MMLMLSSPYMVWNTSNDANVGHFQVLEHPSLPFILACEPKVRLVARVNHELNVASSVDGVHHCFRFVKPSLSVRNLGKAQRIAAGAQGFNLSRHFGIDAAVGLADACVVRVVLNEVARYIEPAYAYHEQ